MKTTHREEGVNDVGLDGAERFVSDHDEDLLLLLQVDEVTEPRLLGQSAVCESTDQSKTNGFKQQIMYPSY